LPSAANWIRTIPGISRHGAALSLPKKVHHHLPSLSATRASHGPGEPSAAAAGKRGPCDRQRIWRGGEAPEAGEKRDCESREPRQGRSHWAGLPPVKLAGS